MLYLASIWVIPIVVAVTFHEAAHGFVARLLGDETAWRGSTGGSVASADLLEGDAFVSDDAPIDWSEHFYENPSRDMPPNLWRRWVQARHPPLGKRMPIEEALRIVVAPMIEQAKADLRREFRSLARRARLRRWSRKDIERFVMSKPRAPE
jgi:hypothetical protein